MFGWLCVCLSAWPFLGGESHRDAQKLHGKANGEIKTNFGKERQHDKDHPGPGDLGAWLKRSVGSSQR